MGKKLVISHVPFFSHTGKLNERCNSFPAFARSPNAIVQIISDWFVCVYLSVFLLPSSSIHLLPTAKGLSDASTQTPPDKYYITSQQ